MQPIAIIGAGAIGGFLAMELAMVDADVVVVDPLIPPERCDWACALRNDSVEIRPKRPPVLQRSDDALRDSELCIVAVKSCGWRSAMAACGSRAESQHPLGRGLDLRNETSAAVLALALRVERMGCAPGARLANGTSILPANRPARPLRCPFRATH